MSQDSYWTPRFNYKKKKINRWKKKYHQTKVGPNSDQRHEECRIYDPDGNLQKVIPKGNNDQPGWNNKWNLVK